MTEPTIEEIQRAVALHFQMKGGVKELVGVEKNAHYVWPRYIAVFLCFKLTGAGTKRICKAFQSRENRIKHEREVVRKRIDIYPAELHRVLEIEDKIKNEKKKKKM